MIANYHRPATLEDALALLAGSDIRSIPIGGGTTLSQRNAEAIEIVDLQALGLNLVEQRGNQIDLGATLTLQALSELDVLPPALRSAAQRETSFNLRQAGTLAGTMVACDGRSPLAAAMLAIDAQLVLISALDQSSEILSYGEILPLRKTHLEKRLITQIIVPGNVRLEIDMVGRTSKDWPVIGVAVAQWPSGRTRITLMGFGATPRLAMDGPEPGGAIEAVQFVCDTAADEWATAEYRKATARVLVERAMTRISNGSQATEGK